MDVRGWRTIKEGQALLREVGMRKAVYDAQLTGPERTVLIRDIKRYWIQQGL